jgi:hypothetical protein
MKTFELEDAPLFKALSYTRGQSETTVRRASTPVTETSLQGAIQYKHAKAHTSDVEVGHDLERDIKVST